MISTISTWINRIRFYENVTEKLLASEKMYRDLSEVNNRQVEKIEKINHENIELRNEWKRFISLLSGDTWKEGDNIMESIEAFQQTKYLKEHAQDFLMIMTQNAPEVAAQELFEYFELEVPDSTNIEIETAKKLYDLWCNAQNSLRFLSSEAEQECIEWSKLRDVQKEFFIQEVYKLWNK